MAKTSGEAKVYVRLVIDEEKKKVVLAESGKDFVDVLFSFLTLPMGTIARLHGRGNVGCLKNLYASVVDMGVDHFQSEACKRMLLCPRSVSDVQCQRLKVNVNPAEGDKYFKCPRFTHCRLFSNFNTTRCRRCGNLMKEEIYESQIKAADNLMQKGVFVSGGGDSTTFIITDELEVSVKSTGLVLERLRSLGCADVSKLGEKFVGIGSNECVFSSNAPLTETFLNKGSPPQGVTKSYETLRPFMEMKKDEADEPEDVLLTINAVVRKKDMKILFVDCGDDFVELLLSFLALPLESVWEMSGNTFGCLANLCRSFKGLRVVNQGTNAPEAGSNVGLLPCFYSFKVQLPGIITLQPPVYYRYIRSSLSKPVPIYALTRDSNKIPYSRHDKLVPVTLVDPKSHGDDLCSGGFLKKETKFTVSDDLVITPMSSCSTVCLLKKLQTNAQDFVVQVISLTKAEAVDLLRASLVTSCALSTALCHLIAKKPKKEPVCQTTQLRRSQRKKHKVNQC